MEVIGERKMTHKTHLCSAYQPFKVNGLFLNSSLYVLCGLGLYLKVEVVTTDTVVYFG